MKYLGPKHSIIVGLIFETIQLAIFGFGSQHWLMWLGGCVAAMGSITYPAISAFVSNHASADQQGMNFKTSATLIGSNHKYERTYVFVLYPSCFTLCF